MINDNGLKSCPFCGEKASVSEKSYGNKSNGTFTATYSIGCNTCKIFFTRESTFHLELGLPVFDMNGYEEAKSLWNRRVE